MQLPEASPTPLPLNKEAEEMRASGVEKQFGNVSPGLVQYTTDVLFRDLWLRPDLAARDRSPATVAALIAAGQAAQVLLAGGLEDADRFIHNTPERRPLMGF